MSVIVGTPLVFGVWESPVMNVHLILLVVLFRASGHFTFVRRLSPRAGGVLGLQGKPLPMPVACVRVILVLSG